VRPELERNIERREHGDHDQLAIPDRQSRPREHATVALREDPLRQIRMVRAEASDHPPVERPVDASAEPLAAATEVATALRFPDRVRGDFLEDPKGVDGPGVPRKGNDLEKHLVQPTGRRPRAEGGPDPAPERTLVPEGGGDRNARQP
jgi:hypothetical protein